MNQQGYKEKHQNIHHSTHPINLKVEKSYPKVLFLQYLNAILFGWRVEIKSTKMVLT
jgi:hypothetical protein